MEQPAEQPVKKKVYEAPTLVRYGDLVEVTRALSGSGASDHGPVGAKTA
jgi:hypothetical protein